MFKPDPKKIAITILSKGKPESEPEADDMADDPSEPLRAAAQDVLDAVKAGSAEDLADALRSAFELLDQPEGDQDEP